jgi:hypothetical protein
MVRGPFLNMLARNIEAISKDVRSCFQDPDEEKLKQLLQNIVDSQETIKDNSFSEGALQCEIEAALRATKEVPVIRAEKDNKTGRCDLYIEMNQNIKIVIEFKRIRPNGIDHKTIPGELPEELSILMSKKRINWYTSYYQQLKDHLQELTDDQIYELRTIEARYGSSVVPAVSVKDLEASAGAQCIRYKRAMGATYGFTVIQVGWRLLVRKW